jgi:hypothetical protein
MKRYLLLPILATALWAQPTQVNPISGIPDFYGYPPVSALPSTCSVGQAVFLTTGTTGLHSCTATNTWSRQIGADANGNVTIGTTVLGLPETPASAYHWKSVWRDHLGGSGFGISDYGANWTFFNHYSVWGNSQGTSGAHIIPRVSYPFNDAWVFELASMDGWNFLINNAASNAQVRAMSIPNYKDVPEINNFGKSYFWGLNTSDKLISIGANDISLYASTGAPSPNFYRASRISQAAKFFRIGVAQASADEGAEVVDPVLSIGADATDAASYKKIGIGTEFPYNGPSAKVTVVGSGYFYDPSVVGAEKLANTAFSADTDWGKAAGWTIAGGVAHSDGSGNPSNIYQNPGFSPGGLYKVTWTIKNYVSGTAQAVFGGSVTGTYGPTRAANGTYTEYVKDGADANAYFSIYSNAFVGDIDDVSVVPITGGSVTAAGGFSVPGGAGYTGTKTAGACTLTIQGGIITGVGGC